MADVKAEDFVRLVTLSIPAPVTALAFSEDGKLLAVGAADKVHIFQVPQKAVSAVNPVDSISSDRR